MNRQTTSLVRKLYNIESSGTIILCVFSAVEDFANSEAYTIAREYDPDGSRTIGIVTKADMVCEGSDIISKLRGEGNNIKLPLGMVAVRNRMPKELEISLSELRALEKDLFFNALRVQKP